MKVAVVGAGGAMGSTVCRTVVGQSDMTLVAAVDPKMAGIDFYQVTGVKANGVQVVGDVSVLPMLGVDVVVDFTNAEAARRNLLFFAKNKIRCVVGTTGFSSSDISHFQEVFAREQVGAILASNFSIGAVLMMQFARLAAGFFDSAEIVEMHHERKVDAPSGTAIETARAISEVRERIDRDFIEDPTTRETLSSARGAQGGANIRIHSLRTVGAVAHQEVIFGTVGQSLSLRHDSYDRSSFMPGVVMALKEVFAIDSLRLGIDWIVQRELDEFFDTKRGED